MLARKSVRLHLTSLQQERNGTRIIKTTDLEEHELKLTIHHLRHEKEKKEKKSKRTSTRQRKEERKNGKKKGLAIWLAWFLVEGTVAGDGYIACYKKWNCGFFF